MKTCLMYAGQGSQYAGMGLDIISKYPHLQCVIDDASQILNEDVMAWFNDPESLKNTYQTQLMMVITQELFDQVLKDIHIDAVFGFSLGDMSALKRAGIITFKEMLVLTQARAKAMQLASETSEGMMAAVLKLEPNTIEKICLDHSKNDYYMMPVNYNAPLQTVISGHIQAYDEIKQACVDAGGKVLPLRVAGAFHTPLMSTHTHVYEDVIDTIELKAPTINIFSNVTGDITNIITKQDLIKQMTSPVRLTSIFKQLKSLGFTHLIEIGPGNVLSQLAIKQLEDISVLTYSNALSLEE
jgi:[acyl-carrier-protein] S-malonyltransferase